MSRESASALVVGGNRETQSLNAAIRINRGGDREERDGEGGELNEFSSSCKIALSLSLALARFVNPL